ncbi:MAG: MOSC domain-containing protein [Burkholderiaceae bacterium]
MNTLELCELTIYPVKSCAGIPLREATLTPAGLTAGGVRDREWMLVDADGRFLTQREHPSMATVAPQLHDGGLRLTAPRMPAFTLPAGPAACLSLRRVQVWDDEVATWDAGDEAAAWLRAAIDIPCRLVRFHPEARRAADPDWTGGIDAPALFSDGFPYLMLYQESLAELNQRLRDIGRAPLPASRFRPNLVFAGGHAFEEDFTATIDFGDAVLRPVKPCPRCPIPSVDQRTGTVGPDPRDVLRSERSDPRLKGMITFGSNCVLISGSGATLTVGRAARADLAFD